MTDDKDIFPIVAVAETSRTPRYRNLTCRAMIPEQAPEEARYSAGRVAKSAKGRKA